MERPAGVEVRRAHMANSIGSEHQPPSRSPIRLVGSVLLLGTLLAWWGTRDHRRLFGESPREPVAAGGMVFPQAATEESAFLDRGSQISQRQCVCCPERALLSRVPSCQDIATVSRRRLPTSAGKLDLRSRLAL